MANDIGTVFFQNHSMVESVEILLSRLKWSIGSLQDCHELYDKIVSDILDEHEVGVGLLPCSPDPVSGPKSITTSAQYLYLRRLTFGPSEL